MDILRAGGNRRAGARLLAAALLAAASAACHGGAPGGGAPLPGPAGRIDPVYDVTVEFPDAQVIVAGLTYTGLDLDLEMTFDDDTVRDADPQFSAAARVVGVIAGGVSQAFSAPQPMQVEGSLDGPAFETDLFGPIQFGTANLVISLAGAVETGAQRIMGRADLFGTTTSGPFTAVRRRRYLIAASDLQSSFGQASLVEVRYDRDVALRSAVADISSDPVARVTDGRPIIVNRLSFDNLQGLDPASGFQTAFQDSTGNGSNPHDVVVLTYAEAGVTPRVADARAGVAFVTRYEPPYDDVALFDLDDGEFLASIDLTPLARNPDHLPRPDRILYLNGLLWVTLEDANRSFTDFETGRLAILDPVAQQVVDVLDLAGQNPFDSLAYVPSTGLIYVGLAGIFPGLQEQALTGGVEAIDPATRQSRGLVVDDDALGGNVSGVAVVSATRGYAVVTDASFHNYVKAFDPSTGTVIGTVYDTTDRLASIAADGDGWVLVAESSFVDPRLLILDGDSGTLRGVLPLGLPPLSIAILTRSL